MFLLFIIIIGIHLTLYLLLCQNQKSYHCRRHHYCHNINSILTFNSCCGPIFDKKYSTHCCLCQRSISNETKIQYFCFECMWNNFHCKKIFCWLNILYIYLYSCWLAVSQFRSVLNQNKRMPEPHMHTSTSKYTQHNWYAKYIRARAPFV